jgi:hypothetical protein
VLGPDGTPDPTFGTDGLATATIPRGDGYAVALDLLLRGDRFTVAGTAGGDTLAARYLLPPP